MAKKRGYRGVVGKAALRGNINKGLEMAASRWVSGVAQSVRDYEAGLLEYLKWYIPRIEQTYQEAIKRNGYATLENRLQVANEVARKTSELAQQLRIMKNEKFIKLKIAAYGGGTMNGIDGINVSGYNVTGGSNPLSYMSNETPKKQAIKNVITV
jgi:hypothetical protein